MDANQFVQIVARRWGYYGGYRAQASELMKATAKERKRITQLGKTLGAVTNQFIEKPSRELKEKIFALRKEIGDQKAILKENGKPYYPVIAKLRKVISHYDKTVIPEGLKALGVEVRPLAEVLPEDLPILERSGRKKGSPDEA